MQTVIKFVPGSDSLHVSMEVHVSHGSVPNADHVFPASHGGNEVQDTFRSCPQPLKESTTLPAAHVQPLIASQEAFVPANAPLCFAHFMANGPNMHAMVVHTMVGAQVPGNLTVRRIVVSVSPYVKANVSPPALVTEQEVHSMHANGLLLPELLPTVMEGAAAHVG